MHTTVYNNCLKSANSTPDTVCSHFDLLKYLTMDVAPPPFKRNPTSHKIFDRFEPHSVNKILIMFSLYTDGQTFL